MTSFDSPPSRLPACSSAIAAASEILNAVLAQGSPDEADAVGAMLTRRLTAVPGARWASITQLRDRAFVTVAASSEVAQRVDDAQYERGDGPCLDAVRGAGVVVADETLLRERWPELAARIAKDTPVRAVLSQPLAADPAFGSLNVYTDDADGMSGPGLAAAADLAAACSLALVALRQRARADNLEVALETNRRIGAAVGVVMATTRCTYEQAFESIRTMSQRTNRKVRDVADEIVLTGVIPGK